MKETHKNKKGIIVKKDYFPEHIYYKCRDLLDDIDSDSIDNVMNDKQQKNRKRSFRKWINQNIIPPRRKKRQIKRR